MVDGHEEYEIEELLSHRFHRKQLQFLVKWKGHPHDKSLWLAERDLARNAGESVAAYKRIHNL